MRGDPTPGVLDRRARRQRGAEPLHRRQRFHRSHHAPIAGKIGYIACASGEKPKAWTIGSM